MPVRGRRSLAVKKWAVTHARSFQVGLASEEVETQGCFKEKCRISVERKSFPFPAQC